MEIMSVKKELQDVKNRAIKGLDNLRKDVNRNIVAYAKYFYDRKSLNSYTKPLYDIKRVWTNTDTDEIFSMVDAGYYDNGKPVFLFCPDFNSSPRLVIKKDERLQKVDTFIKSLGIPYKLTLEKNEKPKSIYLSLDINSECLAPDEYSPADQEAYCNSQMTRSLLKGTKRTSLETILALIFYSTTLFSIVFFPMLFFILFT